MEAPGAFSSTRREIKKKLEAFTEPQLNKFPLSLSRNPLSKTRTTMVRRSSHKSRTSKMVCALLFAAALVAGRVSAESLPQFPGEGGQSAASAAASSAAFAADSAARSAALLSECHRVLRMGGIWQFSTPDHNRHPYQPKSESEFRGYHFWHYTREELQALLSPFFTSIQIAIVHPSESLFATCRK